MKLIVYKGYSKIAYLQLVDLLSSAKHSIDPMKLCN